MSENEQKAGCVDALLPCPFCGSAAMAVGPEDGTYCVRCSRGFHDGEYCWAAVGENYDQDGMPTHMFGSAEDAAAAWNQRAALEAAALSPARSGEAVAWVRFRSDGGIEGPILDAQLDDIRRRSGAWTPLGVIAPGNEEAVGGAVSLVAEIGDLADRYLSEVARSMIAPRNESSGGSPGSGEDARNIRREALQRVVSESEEAGLYDIDANTPAPQDSVRVGDGEWRLLPVKDADIEAACRHVCNVIGVSPDSKWLHGSDERMWERHRSVVGTALHHYATILQNRLTTPAPAAGADGEDFHDRLYGLKFVLFPDPDSGADPAVEVPLTLGATFGSGDNEVAYLHPTEGKLAIAALSDGAGQSAGGGS